MVGMNSLLHTSIALLAVFFSSTCFAQSSNSARSDSDLVTDRHLSFGLVEFGFFHKSTDWESKKVKFGGSSVSASGGEAEYEVNSLIGSVAHRPLSGIGYGCNLQLGQGKIEFTHSTASTRADGTHFGLSGFMSYSWLLSSAGSSLMPDVMYGVEFMGVIDFVSGTFESNNSVKKEDDLSSFTFEPSSGAYIAYSSDELVFRASGGLYLDLALSRTLDEEDSGVGKIRIDFEPKGPVGAYVEGRLIVDGVVVSLRFRFVNELRISVGIGFLL